MGRHKKKKINTIMESLKQYNISASINNISKEVYDNENKYIINDNITNIIHQTFEDNNKEELFNILKKILPQQQIIKLLLEYEMLYYKPEEIINNIITLMNKAKKLLKRYQWKVGGFNIEDPEWTIINKSNNIFILNENDKVLMNTIDPSFSQDSEFLSFIFNITNLIQRYTDKITIRFKIKEYHELSWIFIIFSETIS